MKPEHAFQKAGERSHQGVLAPKVREFVSEYG